MFHIKSKLEYNQQYQASISDFKNFWKEISRSFFWFKEPTKISNCDLAKGEIKWFEDGQTNIAYNCLDRHLKDKSSDPLTLKLQRGICNEQPPLKKEVALRETQGRRIHDKVAIIWEANNPNEEAQKITYRELHQKTCQFANLLVARGIKKGDRVAIYMPMIPESVVAMLACARIGAVHLVVFAGFSAKALAQRMVDSGAKMLITADFLYRGEKEIELLDIALEALQECDLVEEVVVYQRDDVLHERVDGVANSVQRNMQCTTEVANSIQRKKEKESWTEFVIPSTHSCQKENYKILSWQEEIKKYLTSHQAEILNAEDPLFILYTSGSTGKPKGILHTTGGYMTYAGYSFKNVFQYREGEIFFCSADIGWITGHSYLVYGPLLNGATILMFEGIPTYPTASRFWEVIEKHKVNIFYTAPTAIRALMQKGDEFLEGHDLSSLRVLGTVGEPINEEAWQWYFDKIGNKKCPIVDTWWQTETGGIMISSLAGVIDSKPAYAGLPLPGIAPILIDDEGREITENNKVGNLCFKQPWPGMMRGVWGDEKKFLSYFVENKSGMNVWMGLKTTSSSGGELQTPHSTSSSTNNNDTVMLSLSKHDSGFGLESCFDKLSMTVYFAGDGAFRDDGGLYRIIGRIDDVIKVSGHRLGTAEIENAINSHPNVAESAVIGVPHDIKGEAIYAFVILKQPTKNIESEITKIITKEIGAIAKPDKIYITPDLPKTRSGKIMRRILKKIIAKEKDFGDVSTLVNPEILDNLKKLLT